MKHGRYTVQCVKYVYRNKKERRMKGNESVRMNRK
jgi:hypothetical protein